MHRDQEITSRRLRGNIAAVDRVDNPDPEPLKIRNPVKHLDHAKREVVRYFNVPAEAMIPAAHQGVGRERP
jgi:hypothetical protein